MTDARPQASDLPRAIAQRNGRLAATLPVLAEAFQEIADTFVRIAADREIPLDEIQVGAFMTKDGRIVLSLVDSLALMAVVNALDEHEPVPLELDAYFDDNDP